MCGVPQIGHEPFGVVEVEGQRVVIILNHLLFVAGQAVLHAPADAAAANRRAGSA